MKLPPKRSITAKHWTLPKSPNWRKFLTKPEKLPVILTWPPGWIYSNAVWKPENSPQNFSMPKPPVTIKLSGRCKKNIVHLFSGWLWNSRWRFLPELSGSGPVSLQDKHCFIIQRCCLIFLWKIWTAAAPRGQSYRQIFGLIIGRVQSYTPSASPRFANNLAARSIRRLETTVFILDTLGMGYW